MALNPMQRKSRVSFLIGMLVMLIISSIVIAFLVMQLMGKMKEESKKVPIYVLTTDIKSGQTITEDMYTTVNVSVDLVPSNAIGNSEFFGNYALQDKEGNKINYETDDKGNLNLIIEINGKKYNVEFDAETDNYYYMKDNNKQVLTLNTVPLIAKVNMNKNTVLTSELITKGENKVSDDMRKQEYNMISLPMDLKTGDYVDIRFLLPNGQDYIVVSKKEVSIPMIGSEYAADTVWMNLSEDETLCLNSAIVESYRLNGSKLYATKYTEAGMQTAAVPTYVPNSEVTDLINSNPNIVTTAMAELKARYSDTNKALRNNEINTAINNTGDIGKSNVESKMAESITNSQQTRKTYLESLSTGAAATTTSESTSSSTTNTTTSK